MYLEFGVRRVLCRRGRNETITDVTRELHLEWDSVKTLDQPCMRAQLARADLGGTTGIEDVARREQAIAHHLVEGLTNKIRVIQRRAYGLRDEE